MHELSLAMSLIEEVEGVLRKENSSKALSVSVSIGKFSGVEREPFEFCFPLAAEGTKLEGARLEITEIPVSVLCEDCNAETHPEIPLVACVQCHSSNVRIIEGREFLLTSLEVE